MVSEMKRILAYGLTEEHFKMADSLFPGMLRKTDAADLDETVGSLFAGEKERQNVSCASGEEYLIFSGFQNEEIGAFVSRLRKEAYSYDGILAALTETNREWPLRRLLEDTAAEHRYFQERKNLTALVRWCETLDQKQVSEETTELIMISFAALSGSRTDADQLKRIGMRLAASLEKDGVL